MTGAGTGVLLGVFLGMRHALEPDHVAAISVLATEHRDARRGVLLGAWWGTGHFAALLAVGLALALLGVQMPAPLADACEIAVAVMLILLGLRAIGRSVRTGGTGPLWRHEHGRVRHVHTAGIDHVHLGRWALAKRPLAVGIAHGLAGSGALTTLVVTELPSMAERLLFITLFGLGSMFGMATLSGLAGLPLARAGRDPVASRLLVGLMGAASAGLGLHWGWSHISP